MQTFRRILLTFGVLALAAGLFLFLDSLIHNLQLDTTNAEVYEVEEQTYDYKPGKNAPTEQHSMNYYTAKYDYKGEHIKGFTAAHVKGLSYAEEQKLEMGDKVTLYVDPADGDPAIPRSYFGGLVQCIIAAVMIIIGRKGVKNYREKFVKRYSLAFLLTCVFSGIVLVYAVWEEFIYTAPKDGMMPGMNALGWFVFLFILMFLALVVEIPAWIASLIMLRKKEKH